MFLILSRTIHDNTTKIDDLNLKTNSLTKIMTDGLDSLSLNLQLSITVKTHIWLVDYFLQITTIEYNEYKIGIYVNLQN